MENGKLSASDVLEGVVNNNTADRISLFDIRDSLHERGFGLLMVIFSLPIAIPFPYPPGFTTVVGIPLILFAVQMILGFDAPWLPKWIGNKSVNRSTLASIIEKASPYLRKVERLLRTRLSFASSATGEKVIGLFCFACAVAIALPIPLGNAIPALAILFMSLGLLSRDGIVIILGMIVAVTGIVLSIAVVVFGVSAVVTVFSWLQDWLGFM